MNSLVLTPSWRSGYASCVVAACLLLASCSSPGGKAGSEPLTGTPVSGRPPVGGGAPVVTSHPSPDATPDVSAGAKALTLKPASVVPRAGSNSTPRTVAKPTGTSTSDARLAPQQSGCLPTVLTIASVGIDERVRALGLNAQGQIYPPRRTTMWYTGSAVPGQDGISVIAGHVTYDGPDNFYNLVKVTAGGSVDLQCASGGGLSLRVVRTASVPKTVLQTDQSVWGTSPSPVVVLITCDPTSRMVNGHHLNNFIAWTKPV